MNEYNDQMQPFTLYLPPEGRDGRISRQKRSRRLLFISLTVVILGAIALSLLTAYTFKHFFSSPQPLSADTNTLYLANWSRNLGGWSGGGQWQWEKPGIINNDNNLSPTDAPLLLAPYHSSSQDIEVDAQIQDESGFNEFETFGIVIGVDSRGNGYFCGFDNDTYKFIERLSSGSKLSAMTENTTWGSSGEHNEGDYYTYTVKIQKSVMTLFINGWQTAQAPAPAYQPDGSIGLLAYGDGGVKVRGFRVEKLS